MAISDCDGSRNGSGWVVCVCVFGWGGGLFSRGNEKGRSTTDREREREREPSAADLIASAASAQGRPGHHSRDLEPKLIIGHILFHSIVRQALRKTDRERERERERERDGEARRFWFRVVSLSTVAFGFEKSLRPFSRPRRPSLASSCVFAAARRWFRFVFFRAHRLSK